MSHLIKSVKKLNISLISYCESRFLALLIATIYTIILLLLLLNRFWQFEAFYGDQGYFESAIWQVSRFQAPIVEHGNNERILIFADHFVPSIFILSPLYWFTQSYAATIVAISAMTGLSVLVAYEIAEKFIRSKLIIYALLFAYMFYIGMQNSLIFFIHPVTLMFLPLMLLFWSIFKNRKILYYFILFLNLGFIEHISLLVIALGPFLYFYKKEWKLHAIITIAIGVLYAILVTKILIPFLTGRRFYWQPEWPTSIDDLLRRMFLPYLKIETVLVSFATFLFLPLLVPEFLPVIGQDFFKRFVIAPQEGTFRFDLGLHYNANLAVLLFIASVLAINKLQKRKIFQNFKFLISVVIVTIVIIFHQFIYHGPFGLVYNSEFFKHTKRQGFMWDFIDKIPKEGIIMTQNNIAVFFTHNDLYNLSNCERINEVQPDVIAYDFRPGQNPNNMWPITEESMKELTSLLKESSAYSIGYRDQYRFVFQKTNNAWVNINCPKHSKS